MSDAKPFQTQIDGRPATAMDLSPLAFAGFAHFTAMQVRDGCVRGLDLHLARLKSASNSLFGQAMPDDEVQTHLRAAVAEGPAELSLMATMFSRSGEFTPQGSASDPSVLVRTAPAFNGPTGPLRLSVVAHERPLASIKHVGETPKTHYLRRAVEDGFDDAAFLDRNGRLSEATIWNLVFWDGDAVIWPEATVLVGVTMGIVRRQLDALGVPQHQAPVTPRDLTRLKGAAVMNSWSPGIAVSRIGSADLPVADGFLQRLHETYENENPMRL